MSRPGPLSGIRIVEFAGIGPGPFAAMLLADLGAEMVRIDRPADPPIAPTDVLSRNRIRVRADLKNPEHVAQVLALVDGADALIEGFRPGVMERLGLGPKPLLERNPRLVYGRVTGWGQDGPWAQVAGHDINYIGITGALHAIGPAGQPLPPLNLIGDYGGALYLALGMLSALLAVKNGAPGQVVDAAMCDAAASMMAVYSTLAARGEWAFERASNFLDGAAPYYRTYACADGRHISVGPLEPQFFQQLCRTIGIEVDEATRSDPAHWPALSERFAEIFATKTSLEWEALLSGSDACFAPVLTFAEAPEHEHLKARRTFVTRNGLPQPAPEPRFSATPPGDPVDSVARTMAEQIEAWRRG
jgi:alpha-methylacyl-CoA racemase